MQSTNDREEEIAMKRLTCAVLAAVIGLSLALAAGAGARTQQPPTTASLMPAYVAAAKYWLARPLPHVPA
jgi:hypothetical protein